MGRRHVGHRVAVKPIGRSADEALGLGLGTRHVVAAHLDAPHRVGCRPPRCKGDAVEHFAGARMMKHLERTDRKALERYGRIEDRGGRGGSRAGVQHAVACEKEREAVMRDRREFIAIGAGKHRGEGLERLGEVASAREQHVALATRGVDRDEEIEPIARDARVIGGGDRRVAHPDVERSPQRAVDHRNDLPGDLRVVLVLGEHADRVDRGIEEQLRRAKLRVECGAPCAVQTATRNAHVCEVERQPVGAQLRAEVVVGGGVAACDRMGSAECPRAAFVEAPVAVLVFGESIGRAVAALGGWRPGVEAVHTHVDGRVPFRCIELGGVEQRIGHAGVVEALHAHRRGVAQQAGRAVAVGAEKLPVVGVHLTAHLARDDHEHEGRRTHRR